MKKIFVLLLALTVLAMGVFSIACEEKTPPADNNDTNGGENIELGGGGEGFENDVSSVHTCTIDSNKEQRGKIQVCTICNNGYIYFGEYPQTLKADNVTVASTPDDVSGYYLGSDGERYAKVTAAPYGSGYKFSNGTSVTDGTTYYFKVEPILWRVIAKSNDSAIILCDSIIANNAFDGSSNNYEESDIRVWLQDEFYEKAFDDEEIGRIMTTLVDNSVASTGYSPNSYVCEDTEDEVFLLSYDEVTDSAYGFNDATDRQMLTSDYSRATGAYMSTESLYYGNGWWWLRSPYDFYSLSVRYVCDYGDVSSYDYYYNGAYSADGGVVPALQIALSE